MNSPQQRTRQPPPKTNINNEQSANLKTLLLCGLVSKANRSFNHRKSCLNPKERKVEFGGRCSKNNSISKSIIDEEDKEQLLKQECRKICAQTEKSLKKFLIKKKNAFKSNQKCHLSKQSSKDFSSYFSMKDEIKEDGKFVKDKTENHIRDESLFISLTSEKHSSNSSHLNTKHRTISNEVSKGNKYIARKKQEVYVFAHLNKTLENFSQKNQYTAGIQILNLFLKSLAQGKQSLSSCTYEILGQKKECQSRIGSYIDNLTQIIKEILLNTSKIIPNGQGNSPEYLGFLEHLKKKMENASLNPQDIISPSRKYINITQTSELEIKIKYFTKLCSSANQFLKEFLLSPFIRNLFNGKSKVITILMRKVMQGRYTFGYLQKQIENFNLPNARNFRIKKNQEKWVSAFKKKFLPKTISGLRF